MARELLGPDVRDRGRVPPAVGEDHRYLGDFVAGVPDWNVGDTFTDNEGRSLRILAIEPARVLGAIHATWTVEEIGASTHRWREPR